MTRIFRIQANKVGFLVGHPNGKTSSLQVLRVGGHRCHLFTAIAVELMM